MSTRFSSNSKVIEAVKTLVAKYNATGDVSVLPERSERSEELMELVRHGNNFGYDIRNYGFEGVDLVHGEGYLTDIIIHEELLVLDYNLVKHLEKEINDHSRYIGKPQKVRDDEHFTKRNIIIRRHMYDPVMSGSIFLQPGEPGHVNNAIYNKRNGMFIFQIEDP